MRDSEKTSISPEQGAQTTRKAKRSCFEDFEVGLSPGAPDLHAPYVSVSQPSGRPTAPLRASVILSTYNQPTLLDRTLLGYARQSVLDFEIVVADDGSGAETRECIEFHQSHFPVRLVHVWQPDDGFHKSRAVNRAALSASADYLIFSDGDCIPSRHFVREHLDAASEGTYVVGGFVRLSRRVTETLSGESVATGAHERCARLGDRLKLRLVHAKSVMYIAVGKRRKPKFYGLNFSVSLRDFVRVNGFDETYHNCGREDSDLRNRMQLAGMRARSLWYRPGVFHQFHPGHPTRHGWADVDRYYNRPDLRPEAPCGLRELQAQGRASTNAL